MPRLDCLAERWRVACTTQNLKLSADVPGGQLIALGGVEELEWVLDQWEAGPATVTVPGAAAAARLGCPATGPRRLLTGRARASVTRNQRTNRTNIGTNQAATAGAPAVSATANAAPAAARSCGAGVRAIPATMALDVLVTQSQLHHLKTSGTLGAGTNPTRVPERANLLNEERQGYSYLRGKYSRGCGAEPKIPDA